ncbi:hypothetical protein IE53DRAFT_200552 [Violaceomyces palustris]|uniref:Uncharacterized protein n=1 Tax=Violaceomyces palustris TaxID=1673888 RepID=A0ACD0NRA4_9BASI|nr:hypothetical protein IE53DRAFT_200552 [Violaceomyces palustris]
MASFLFTLFLVMSTSPTSKRRSIKMRTTLLLVVATQLLASVTGHKGYFDHDEALHRRMARIRSVRRQSDGGTGQMQLYKDASQLESDFGLSSECAGALMTSFNCDDRITHFGSSPSTNTTFLDAVCRETCDEALNEYRRDTLEHCQGESFAGYDNSTYAITDVTDQLILNYQLGCLKDSSTGSYCVNTDSSPCSDCGLKSMNRTLSNPVGYSEYLANALYDRLKNECKGSQYVKYNVTGPPDSSSTSDPNGYTPIQRNCTLTGYYADLDSSMDCDQIAQAYQVSYFNVLTANPTLSVSNCQVKAGQSVCLPKACETYVIKQGDDCTSIMEQNSHNVTRQQLVSFNPELGLTCSQAPNLVGKRICVSPNGGWSDVSASPTNGSPNSQPTAAAPVPSNIAPNTTTSCSKYYQTMSGDYCFKITLRFGISLDQFIDLNPMIDQDCSNLWANTSYCVDPYPPYGTPTTTSTPTPTPVTDHIEYHPDWTLTPLPTESVTTVASSVLPTAQAPAPTNLAPGSIDHLCGIYYVVGSNDTCDSIAQDYTTDLADLERWNSELPCGTSLASFQGKAICTLGPRNYTEVPVARAPSNVAGAANQTICGDYADVEEGDECDDFAALYGMYLEDLIDLNPGLSSDCSNFEVGEAYCVSLAGVPLFPEDGNDGGGSGSGSSSGSDEGCTSTYKVVQDDTCQSIATSHALTVEQLLQLNSGIDADCTNLSVGQTYCMSNATIPGSSTSDPDQGGGVEDDCAQRYESVDGDTCDSISKAHSISTSTLESLNPSLDCGGGSDKLTSGQSVCVQGCTSRYTVQSGDTCYDIADSHGTTVSAIQSLNPGLDCDLLSLGEKICLASSSSSSSPSDSNGSGSNDPEVQCDSNPYTVQSGDTCYDIASQHVLTTAELLAENPGLDCQALRVGQTVCLGAKACFVTHTVESGENCHKIASRFKVDFDTFKSRNPDLSCTKIQVGDIVCLGPDACLGMYTVQSGDTCHGIASSHNLDFDVFKSKNPGIHCTQIKAGDQVCI